MSSKEGVFDLVKASLVPTRYYHLRTSDRPPPCEHRYMRYGCHGGIYAHAMAEFDQ